MTSRTARFANVVKAAGRPRPVTLWTAPEENRDFMTAVRAHRVMTVKQANVGARKDYGEVGFLREPQAAYLEFPKSLKQFESRRIIGIDYHLLAEQPRSASPRPVGATRTRAPRRALNRRQPPAPKPPVEHTYRLIVKRQGTQFDELPVRARTAAEAKRKALHDLRSQPLTIPAGQSRDTVQKVLPTDQ